MVKEKSEITKTPYKNRKEKAMILYGLKIKQYEKVVQCPGCKTHFIKANNNKIIKYCRVCRNEKISSNVSIKKNNKLCRMYLKTLNIKTLKLTVEYPRSFHINIPKKLKLNHISDLYNTERTIQYLKSVKELIDTDITKIENENKK